MGTIKKVARLAGKDILEDDTLPLPRVPAMLKHAPTCQDAMASEEDIDVTITVNVKRARWLWFLNHPMLNDKQRNLLLSHSIDNAVEEILFDNPGELRYYASLDL